MWVDDLSWIKMIICSTFQVNRFQLNALDMTVKIVDEIVFLHLLEAGLVQGESALNVTEILLKVFHLEDFDKLLDLGNYNGVFFGERDYVIQLPQDVPHRRVRKV